MENDDGTLEFLKIPKDETFRYFDCPEISQRQLLNTRFVVTDFIDGVKTKFGDDRFLVKIETDKGERKFFTNATEIKHILSKVKELGKFPRNVTMRSSGNRYHLE